jgi:hypothetical protein
MCVGNLCRILRLVSETLDKESELWYNMGDCPPILYKEETHATL